MLNLASFLYAFLFFAHTISASNERILKAASKRSSLIRRSPSSACSNSAELQYAEDDNPDGSDTFHASVIATSDHPILVLEQIEDWLVDVSCSGDLLELTSAGPDFRSLAWIDEITGGHVITSHASCNQIDERVLYQIESVHYVSEHIMTFKVVSAPWKESLKHLVVQMGHTEAGHEFRSHQEHSWRTRKRQVGAPEASLALSAAVPTITAATPVSVDVSAPTDSEFDISNTLVTQKIQLPDNPPFNLTCNYCSINGTIDLSWSQWTFSDEGINGYGNLTTNGLSAYIDLATSVKEQWSFSEPLLPVRAQSTSFRVPGLGAASLAWGPFLAGGFSITAPLGLTSYGFELAVPDGSYATFGIDGFDASAEEVGFDNTITRALAWNADYELPSSLDLWLAARLLIAVSFTFIGGELSGSGKIVDVINDGSATLNAGLILDLPVLNASLAAVQNVDYNCEPTDNSTDIKLLTDAAKITFAAGYNYGAYANGHFGDLIDNFNESYYRQGSVSLDLVSPSLCIDFIKKKNHYALAIDAVSGNAAAPSMSRPLTGALAMFALLVIMLQL